MRHGQTKRALALWMLRGLPRTKKGEGLGGKLYVTCERYIIRFPASYVEEGQHGQATCPWAALCRELTVPVLHACMLEGRRGLVEERRD